MTLSIRENHQPRIEDDRQQDMTPNHQREGDDQRPVPPRDLPFERNDVCREDDHHGYAQEADDEGEFEALPDAGYFDPE